MRLNPKDLNTLCTTSITSDGPCAVKLLDLREFVMKKLSDTLTREKPLENSSLNIQSFVLSLLIWRGIVLYSCKFFRQVEATYNWSENITYQMTVMSKEEAAVKLAGQIALFKVIIDYVSELTSCRLKPLQLLSIALEKLLKYLEDLPTREEGKERR